MIIWTVINLIFGWVVRQHQCVPPGRKSGIVEHLDKV